MAVYGFLNDFVSIEEGLRLFGKKSNKSPAYKLNKYKPLASNKKADVKKVIEEIKKIAPSIISNMNKNKDDMDALNRAVDLVDDEDWTNGKPLLRKWICSGFDFFDNRDNILVVCCMDNSIMNAYRATCDDGCMDHHFNKYTSTSIYNAGKEIVSKLTDTYDLNIDIDADSCDGCILFEVSSK